MEGNRGVTCVWLLILLHVLCASHFADAALTWDTFSPAYQAHPTVTVTIDENSAAGTSVLTIAATGGYVPYTYSITSATGSDSADKSAAFTIDASSGAITVASATPLDRETISYVDLVVGAADNTSSISLTVRVGIKDVNELDPAFTPSAVYSPTVLESATVSTVVQTLTVTDNDAASTTVACAITGGDTHSKFQMRSSDNKTIELKATIEPDSPTNDPLSYTLIVQCYDNIDGTYSGGSRTSTGTVSVTVQPVNDHTPEFGIFSPTWTSATAPITTIDENLASGTIFTANATDSDVGVDGVLVFSITSVKFSDGTTDASGLFTIDGTSGVVSRTAATTPAIDRETFSYIDFVLEVRDSSTNTADRKTATRSVRVDIKDVNEFDPVFSPSSGQYNTSFSETSPAGTLVLNVSVSDPDASATAISCSIVNGNALDRYQMRTDGTSIELKTQIEPDAPTFDPVNYVLELSCVDNTAGTYSGGQKTSSATVSVSVLYNNDYSPVWSTFSPAWSSATTAIATIVENIAVNQTVFTANATDLDAGTDGVVVYSIASAVAANGSSVMEVFVINSTTGEVTIANSSVLDREGYGYVDIVVNARDSPTSGTTYTITRTVRLDLSDYNEFPPAFTPASGLYYPVISETIASGTAVQTVVAVDPDYSNTTVVCSLVAGNSLGRFAVNSANKQLVETASVIQPDKPTLDPTAYILTMICSDMNNGTVGTPVLTSTSYITVNVTLVNDYDPTVTLNSTTMVIPEDTPVSSVIVAVTADDLDYGADGVFSITISPSSPFG